MQLNRMSPCEITAAVTALANTMSKEFDDEELALLATVFTLLGDTLATILAAKIVCEKDKNALNKEI